MRIAASKELFAQVFGAVGDLAENNALLTLNENGLHLAAFNVQRTLYAEATAPRELFWNYETTGEEKMGLDPQKIKNYLPIGEKESMWELATSGDTKTPGLLLKSGGYTFNIRLLAPETIPRLRDPNLTFQATLEAPVENLRGLLRSLRKTRREAHLITLQIKQGTLSFQVSNGDQEPLTALTLEPIGLLTTGEATTYLDAPLFTLALSKLLPLRVPTLKIEATHHGPLRLTASLEGGGEVSVLLAPRSPPEEEETPEEPREAPEWESIVPLVLTLSVFTLSSTPPTPPAPAPGRTPPGPRFRLICYMRIEPEEEEALFNTREEAEAEAAHNRSLFPENCYEVEEVAP